MLALALAMDATAVAIGRGAAAALIRPGQILLIAALFGGFQALMPLFGWLLGNTVSPMIKEWDHWVAFLMLTAIGGKMLWEVMFPVEDAQRETRDVFDFKILVWLAIATSIDALAAGIALPMLGAPLALSITVIGLTTASMSALGVVLGQRIGNYLGSRLDIVGGLLLIGLGTKILLEHLLA